MKRIFDILASFFGLIVASPVLIPTLLITYLQDWHSPFYIAPRVGKGFKLFDMVKVRSMIVNADKSGVSSTSSNDNRITPIGRFVRRYKMDEISQLWNVLIGDMSLVGPRPNVKVEVDLYTDEEKHLLDKKPGITDLASIIFSDENDILSGSTDPDLDYNRLIRPWKSKLGLLYNKNGNLWMDIKLIYLTVVAIVNRDKAVQGVHNILKNISDDDELIKVCLRKDALYAAPPPGAKDIVSTR